MNPAIIYIDCITALSFFFFLSIYYFLLIIIFLFTFTFMHLADAFIQSDLQCIQVIHVFVSILWESNPQPFVLLTQCSTTEPQEHVFSLFLFFIVIFYHFF